MVGLPTALANPRESAANGAGTAVATWALMMAPPRSPMWVLSALAVVSVVACSAGGPGSLDGDGGLGDGGGGGDGGGRVCPASAPTVGTACTLQSNVNCTYGSGAGGPACECCGGGNALYNCQGGRWQELATPTGITPPNICPSTMPVDGSACNPCQNHTCGYTCATSNNDPGQATCQAGRWVITRTNVACFVDGGVDAAISDAGPG